MGGRRRWYHGGRTINEDSAIQSVDIVSQKLKEKAYITLRNDVVAQWLNADKSVPRYQDILSCWSAGVSSIQGCADGARR